MPFVLQCNTEGLPRDVPFYSTAFNRSRQRTSRTVFDTIVARGIRAGQPAIGHSEADEGLSDFFKLRLRRLAILLFHSCSERSQQSCEQQRKNDQYDGQFDKRESRNSRRRRVYSISPLPQPTARQW